MGKDFSGLLNIESVFDLKISCISHHCLKYLEHNFSFFFFFLFKATPMAYGDSQARGSIGAVGTSLHHSYNNARSELHL